MSDDLVAEIARHFQPALPDDLGVAVSGGGDSVALLFLLSGMARQQGSRLHAVTVDHGLRSEAAAEAKRVKDICASLRIPHRILRWQGWDGAGNIQAEARQARYQLMAEWAREVCLSQIALGHTLDDQAETVLMRLARGAGVDGLSGMATRRVENGVTWVRPLLSVSRGDLRRYLMEKKIDWIEDPTNDDNRYDRVKARQILAELSPLGITAPTLGRVASNMRQARFALNAQARHAARTLVVEQAGALKMDWPGLLATPEETRHRLIKAALQWISGPGYPPRQISLEATLMAVAEKGAATLNGCLLKRSGPALWICREYNAVKDVHVPVGNMWDTRWQIEGDGIPSDALIAALGATGLASCDDWRVAGLPREVLMVTPAVWQSGNLLCAPLVNCAGAWQAVLQRADVATFEDIFAH